MGIRMKVMPVMVALVMLLLLPGICHALTRDQKVLRGLKGVLVIVTPLSIGAKSLGLIQSQIQTDVEKRLRQAGIGVLTEKAMLGMPEMPCLYVRVTANHESKRGSFSTYMIEVELWEEVTLARGSVDKAIVWNKAISGWGDIISIQGAISDKIDQFINDYLAANPKK
jgi:hypothetical protein